MRPGGGDNRPPDRRAAPRPRLHARI